MSRFFKLENFQKMLKINENFIICEIFKGTFAMFLKSFEILTEILAKFQGKFWTYGFAGGSRGGAPEANENIKNQSKIQWKPSKF